MMEPPGPACLRCVGLDDLEFLAAGDALLSRRRRGQQPAVFGSRPLRSKPQVGIERQGVLVQAAGYGPSGGRGRTSPRNDFPTLALAS